MQKATSDTTEMDKSKEKKRLMHLLIEVLAGLIIAKQTVEELFCGISFNRGDVSPLLKPV